MTQPIPAWYPDPHDPTRIRWWDGQGWTDNVTEHPSAVLATPPPSVPQVEIPGPAAAAVATLAPVELVTVGAPIAPLTPIVPIAPVGQPEPASEAPWLKDAIWPVGAGPTSGSAPSVAQLAPGPAPAPAPLAPMASPPPASGPPPPPPSFFGAEAVAPIVIENNRRGIKWVGIFGLVVVLAIGAVGAYTTGVFDKLTGGSERKASSPSVKVFEGTGYSLEVPKTWKTVGTVEDDETIMDAGFQGPNGSGLMTLRSKERTNADVDLSDPTIAQALYAETVKSIAAFPGAEILAQGTAQLGGVDGVKFTVETPIVEGGIDRLRVVMVLAVRDGRMFGLALTGLPDASFDARFEEALSSFRFEERD